jgi:preprotein translocase subunit SecE
MSKIKNIYTSVVGFVSGSYEEMIKKVTWPKYLELQSSTILVLVATIIFSLIIGLMDILFKNGMGSIYSSFVN